MALEEHGEIPPAESARPPAAGMPSVRKFLQNVVRSRLLDRARLAHALRDAPSSLRDDAPGVAEYLVQAGQLTRYQARKLLKGIALGLVLGPYHVLTPIAKGGMGTVFLARDGHNGPLVTLKILPPRTARRKHRAVVRFLREMVLSKHLRHPHLAWTIEAGQIHGINFIAMEFIPGRNLFHLVSTEGVLSVSRAARLITEAATGLHHAHEQGVIHRDLKPSNIMVTPHDHVKVLDLGLAMVEGETITDHRVVGGQGVIVGTMDYIAPEQTRDAAGVDRRADVYSLGCTLYFALTGQAPFPGGDSKDKIRRHRREEPTPLLQLRPDLPAAFTALVERMMSKEPNQRPATGREVADALQCWVGAEVVLPLDQPEDADYQAAVAAIAVSAEQLPSGSAAEISLSETPGSSLGNLSPWSTGSFWFALAFAFGLLLFAIVAGVLGHHFGWLR